MTDPYGPLETDPTLAEIKAACREIRRHWSPAERRRRLAVKVEPWTAPVAWVGLVEECQATAGPS